MGLKDVIEAVRDYPRVCTELADTQRQLAETAKDLEEAVNAAQINGYEANGQKRFAEALMSVLEGFKPVLTSPDRLRQVYDSVAPLLDKDGYRLYDTAKGLTGFDLYGNFPYEDATGMFETMDGHGMLAYLMAARFGTVESEPIMGTIYERTTRMEADLDSPECMAFQKQLYTEVLRRLGFQVLVDRPTAPAPSLLPQTEQAML